MHPSSPSICATCHAHLILLDLIVRIISGEEQRSLSLLHSPVTSSLLSPNILLSTLFSNTFVPQCARPSFTSTQNNNRHNYSSSWIANCETYDSAPNDSKHFLTSICS
jgi:hypothetical protein